MNILLINSTSNQLNRSLLDFFVQNEKFSFITALNINPGLNLETDLAIPNDKYYKLKMLTCNALDTSRLSSILSSFISENKPHFHVLYVEDPKVEQQNNFLSISFNKLKERVFNELMLKINFFQVLLKHLKSEELEIQIIIIVRPYAQTKLIDEKIEKNILFSSLHMLTTAIADEFIDFGISCNGIVANDSLVETLNWWFFKNPEKLHGKLIADKQVIDW